MRIEKELTPTWQCKVPWELFSNSYGNSLLTQIQIFARMPKRVHLFAHSNFYTITFKSQYLYWMCFNFAGNGKSLHTQIPYPWGFNFLFEFAIHPFLKQHFRACSPIFGLEEGKNLNDPKKTAPRNSLFEPYMQIILGYERGIFCSQHPLSPKNI